MKQGIKSFLMTLVAPVIYYEDTSANVTEDVTRTDHQSDFQCVLL